MRSASASNSPGVTATSCTQATTPNVPTPPKRQPLLGQIYGLTLSLVPTTEPIQRKTLSGWVLDLESTNAEVVQAARQALKDLGPDAAPAIPQLAQMLNDGRTYKCPSK